MSIEDVWLCSLLGRHRVDDCFDALECIVIDVNILEGLAYAGDHCSQFLDVPHLLDLMDLCKEIVEVKLILRYALLETACFSFVVELLSTLYKRDDISHAEDAICHTLGVEDVQCIHLLAHPNELDWLIYDRADR